jgi:hypothetical protein
MVCAALTGKQNRSHAVLNQHPPTHMTARAPDKKSSPQYSDLYSFNCAQKLQLGPANDQHPVIIIMPEPLEELIGARRVFCCMAGMPAPRTHNEGHTATRVQNQVNASICCRCSRRPQLWAKAITHYPRTHPSQNPAHPAAATRNSANHPATPPPPL